VSANVTVILADGCVVTPTTNTITYTLPTITTLAPNTLRARFTNGLAVLSGTNFSGLPVNTPVRVRWASNGNIFAAGTSSIFETTGLTLGGSSISTEVPDATLCGVASVQASVLVFFPDGTCAGNTNVLTYTAPQTAGAGVTGFQPQNLSYEGQTPFTFIAAAGNNDFSNLVGQTVQVEFSVAAGTPFRGGTSDFDVVPGTVASVTTVTGSAPTIVAAGNTLPNVSVRVRFEDGTCTDLADTSYFRADNLLAISGTGGLTLIATSAANPYGTAANAIVAGTPIAGAAAPPGGVVLLPGVNRAYAVNGGNLQIVDLAGPAATAAAGAPTLGAASILGAITLPAAGGAVTVDRTTNRVFAGAGGNVVVVDGASGIVLKTIAVGFGYNGGPLGVVDGLRTVLASGGGNLIRIDADDLVVLGAVPVPNFGVTAPWTGGFAVDAASERVILTYNDPVIILPDYVRAVDATDLTTTLWALPLAPTTDPTGAIAVDATSNRVGFFQAGLLFNTIGLVTLDTGAPQAPSAVPAVGVIVGPGSTNDRMYATSPANNNVTVLTPSNGGVIVAIGVAGAADAFTTSP